MPVRTVQFERACAALPLLEGRAAFLAGSFCDCEKPRADTELQPEQCVRLAFFQWLCVVAIPADQQERIVKHYAHELETLARRYRQPADPAQGRAISVTLADHRACFGLPQARSWYDFVNDEEVVRFSAETYTTCDLAECAGRFYGRTGG